jgi:hypothetical protein
LPAGLLAAPTSFATVRHQERVQAALFKAYIGGLYLSHLRINVNEAGDQCTQGKALDMVGDWLRSTFSPVASWALIFLLGGLEGPLGGESQGIPQPPSDLSLLSPSSARNDLELLRIAHGSTQQLNEFLSGKLYSHCPIYKHERLGEQIWKVVCIAHTRSGKTWLVLPTYRNTYDDQILGQPPL